jgi:hypothetical protein
MAMATAYFDDSGTHSESNSAIAACLIATVKQWRRFTKAWQKASNKAGFKTFHMSEFAARRGEFLGWSDTKRQRVLLRLCTIVTEYVDSGSAVGILKQDYDRIIQGDFRNYCGRYHYTFAIRHCAKAARLWTNRNSEPSIQYVFDQMSKGKGEIMDLMNDAMRRPGKGSLRGFGFQDKTYFPPLQAVDILAWSYFQLVQEKTANRILGWIPKLALDTLIRSNVLHKFYDAVELRNWANQEIEALSRLSVTSTRGHEQEK